MDCSRLSEEDRNVYNDVHIRSSITAKPPPRWTATNSALALGLFSLISCLTFGSLLFFHQETETDALWDKIAEIHKVVTG